MQNAKIDNIEHYSLHNLFIISVIMLLSNTWTMNIYISLKSFKARKKWGISKFYIILVTEFQDCLKGSDRLCKVVELSMQSCGQIL